MRALILGFSIITLAACGGSTHGGPTTAGSGGGSGESSSSGAGATSGGGGSTTCTQGAVVTLPACADPAATSIDVPAGCVPTVDGAYHQGEWDGAACITVGGDPVYVKFANDTLYLAWSMKPTCGCPAQLVFNTDGAQTLDGKQLDLGIFDDPFGAAGDASEFTSAAGGWVMSASVATGIVIANPPNAPPLVTYELSIPFATLGISAGQAHSVGFGVNHPMSGVWPSGLTVPMDMYQPTTPSDWGQLSSSADWQ
jgi:hypothetical protein